MTKTGASWEIGARTRTIPPALRRALLHRDRVCRFPGCGRPAAVGHHIQHWAQGGPTTLSNLVLLCRWHHRAVHEEGYQVSFARLRVICENLVPANVLRRDSFQGGKTRRRTLSQGTNPPAERYAL